MSNYFSKHLDEGRPAIPESEALRLEIEALGITASHFARFVKTNNKTVRRWLRGESVIPGAVWALIDALALLSWRQRYNLLSPTLPGPAGHTYKKMPRNAKQAQDAGRADIDGGPFDAVAELRRIGRD